jgi:hypothetical protein
MLLLGSVRRGEAGEAVALHRAREALALGNADDVGALAGGEDVDLDLLPGLEGFIRAELDDVAQGLDARLGEVAHHRLLRAAALRVAQLDRGIAVTLRGLHLNHPARPRLDHRHGQGSAVLGEDLRHPELLAEDPLDGHQSFSSMSTPAARFSRWSS